MCLRNVICLLFNGKIFGVSSFHQPRELKNSIMKKMVTGAIALLLATQSFAQNDAADKKVRFGLEVFPSLDWYKPSDLKSFAKNGTVLKFGYGLATEFRINDITWFCTGVQVNYSGGDVTFTRETHYFYSDNVGFTNATAIDFTQSNSSNGTKHYWLRERKYKMTYLTVPLMLRLKTKPIGSMEYYGNFGLLASFRLKGKADDVVNEWNSGNGNGYDPNEMTLSNLVITPDMNLFNMGLTIGGGAEYNLSGSTSLIFGVSYIQGFTNTVKNPSQYNIDYQASLSNNNKGVALAQKFLQNSFAINFGFMF